MMQTEHPIEYEYEYENDRKSNVYEFNCIAAIHKSAKDSITKFHNNLYPFAFAIVNTYNNNILDSFYLALEYNPKKTHYTALLYVTPMSMFSKEFFPYSVAVDFKEHIPISTNITFRQPNEQDLKKFAKQLPPSIAEHKLIYMITIDKQDFFFGYYNNNIRGTESITVFNKVK